MKIKMYLRKALYLLVLFLVSTSTLAQKYKKLYETNDLVKLSEKIEKGLKKDSADLLILYYKSKYLAKLESSNLDLSYRLLSRVCNDFDSKLDNKKKEEYLNEDLTYSNAYNFKQSVCKLILDSLELNISSVLDGYKFFNSNYTCDINKIVKFKIDSIEFSILSIDSNISECEKYLMYNPESAFKKEILSIIEFKTIQTLRTNILINETYQNFIAKFPNSIYLPELKFLLFESEINKATLINDTNELNRIALEIDQIGNITYICKAKVLIENSKEKIYYELCEKYKEGKLIDVFLNKYNESVYFERIVFLKDSIEKTEIDISKNEVEEYEYPELANRFGFTDFDYNLVFIDYYYRLGFIDYYSSNLTNSILVKSARTFKEGFASISRKTKFLFDGKEKWTFINKSGKIISDFIFDETHDFSENLAGVKIDGLWGFIDTSGNQVIKCKYQSVGDFKNGFAIVVNITGATYYIDKNGNQYGDGYYLAFNFCNNKRAIVKPSIESLYYIIDNNFNIIETTTENSIYDVTDNLTFKYKTKDGKEIYDLVDSNDVSVNWVTNIIAEACGEGLTRTITFPTSEKLTVLPLNSKNYLVYSFPIGYCDNYFFVINNKGLEVANGISPSINDLYIKNDFLYIRNLNSIYSSKVINLKNKTTLNKFKMYKEFKNGYCAVSNYEDDFKNPKWGFIDEKENLLGNTLKYEDVSDFKNGFAIVKINNKMGVIDRKSNLIGEKIWDNVAFFSKYHFLCNKDDKQVIIDSNGKEVSQYFDFIGQLTEGFAIVKSNGKLGYIDDKGMLAFKLLFPFESLLPFHDGLAPAKYLGKWGFIDITGKFIIPAKYQEFVQFVVNDGFAIVRGDDKTINKNGNTLSDLNYFIIDKNGTKIKDIIYKY